MGEEPPSVPTGVPPTPPAICILSLVIRGQGAGCLDKLKKAQPLLGTWPLWGLQWGAGRARQVASAFLASVPLGEGLGRLPHPLPSVRSLH